MFQRARRDHEKSQVKIQFMSDLHLEYIKYDYAITPSEPYLLLCGDIGRFCDIESFRSWLSQQCSQFKMVFLIAGNHEFYGTSREKGLQAAQELVEDSAMNGKLSFLNRGRFDFPSSDVTILGCTLHSHIASDYTALTNDFNKIRDWRVRDHNAEHELDKEWLKSTLTTMSKEAYPRRVIVATHYAPAFEKTTHPKQVNNPLSQCFSSHVLSELTTWPGENLVQYWTFGHTHWNAKFRSGHIMVRSNQRLNDSTEKRSQLSWWQKRLYRPFDQFAVLQS